MNVLSWIFLIAVAAGLAAAVVYMIKHRGSCSCGCNCSGCSQRCANRKQP